MTLPAEDGRGPGRDEAPRQRRWGQRKRPRAHQYLDRAPVRPVHRTVISSSAPRDARKDSHDLTSGERLPFTTLPKSFWPSGKRPGRSDSLYAQVSHLILRQWPTALVMKPSRRHTNRVLSAAIEDRAAEAAAHRDAAGRRRTIPSRTPPPSVGGNRITRLTWRRRRDFAFRGLARQSRSMRLPRSISTRRGTPFSRVIDVARLGPRRAASTARAGS